MAGRGIVAVGGSAGSLEPLVKMVGGLSADFPHPVMVVMHISPHHPSLLREILDRRGPLPVVTAQDGMVLQPATIYVPQVDHHLLVENGVAHVTRHPRENRHRPAIDPLFKSAGRCYGPGAVGVILSGTLADGSAGLRDLVQHGGTAVVQDPDDSLYRTMPEKAIASTAIEYVVPAGEIAEVLEEIARKQETATSDGRSTPADSSTLPLVDRGENTALVCPDCGGPLQHTEESGEPRFMCIVGHRFTLTALAEAEEELVERAMWAAVAVLEQRGDVARRLSEQMREQAADRMAETYLQRAEESASAARVIRSVLIDTLRNPPAAVHDPD